MPIFSVYRHDYLLIVYAVYVTLRHGLRAVTPYQAHRRYYVEAVVKKCDGEEVICNDDKCQTCCPHEEHDHCICVYCGKDCTDDLVCAAEYACEGER